LLASPNASKSLTCCGGARIYVAAIGRPSWLL
jgi:hypothetical protein